MKTGSLVSVLGLAAALIFEAGCTKDPITGYDPSLKTRYIVRCDPMTRRLQLYEEQTEPDYFPGSPFGLVEVPVESPINGKSCSVSTEVQGRPFTLGQALNKGLLISPTLTKPDSLEPDRPPSKPDATAGPATRLPDAFPGLMPLLFAPQFTVADSGKVHVDCPPNEGFYLVNHIEGTVSSVGLCPSLHVLKEIPVASNPLQLAETPDGTMVLVTSYDSAVNFIETASDMVVFTLTTPNYYPSGIAISPDGARAYVTSYDDVQKDLLVIDIPNRKLLTAIPLTNAFPRVVVLTPDGAQAWVNYYQGSSITIVDTLTNSVAREVNIGVGVSNGMAFNPTGTKAFIAANPNTVIVMNTSSLGILARITVGGAPTDIVADPDGRNVFVDGGSDGRIWVIDAVRNRLDSASEPTSPAASGASRGLLVFR
jgi:DNA-binding beta-propeller fold protein YncE